MTPQQRSGCWWRPTCNSVAPTPSRDAGHDRLPHATDERRVHGVTGDRTGSSEVEARTETPDMARIRGSPARPRRIPAGGPVQDLLGDACGRAARATSRTRGPARRRGSPPRPERLGARTERRRQQASQQLMVAMWQAHGELVTRAPVQLRGPTRPRAASPGEAAVLGPEHADLDELVKVERGQRAADADGFSRFVSADCFGLAFHVLVQPSSRGLAEGGHRLELAWDPWHLHMRMVGGGEDRRVRRISR